VSGSVGDIQQLIRPEAQLARTEMKQEWDKARNAAGAMALGTVLLILAALMFCFTFVYLIHLADLPLTACFAIIGGVLGIAGLIFAGLGYSQATRVHLIPSQTAETLKENVSWTQNPR